MIDFQDLDVLADLIFFGSLNIPYRKCLLKTYLIWSISGSGVLADLISSGSNIPYRKCLLKTQRRLNQLAHPDPESRSYKVSF
jgi:hypothetical protein